jgi:hypothetical protein
MEWCFAGFDGGAVSQNDKFGERTATGVESAVSKTAFPPLEPKRII